MKIAVRCIYHLPVTPNFIIVDLPYEVFQAFLGARLAPWERVNIIRPYITKPGPTEIKEIAWIPLDYLSNDEKDELKEALD